MNIFKRIWWFLNQPWIDFGMWTWPMLPYPRRITHTGQLGCVFQLSFHYRGLHHAQKRES